MKSIRELGKNEIEVGMFITPLRREHMHEWREEGHVLEVLSVQLPYIRVKWNDCYCDGSKHPQRSILDTRFIVFAEIDRDFEEDPKEGATKKEKSIKSASRSTFGHWLLWTLFISIMAVTLWVVFYAFFIYPFIENKDTSTIIAMIGGMLIGGACSVLGIKMCTDRELLP